MSSLKTNLLTIKDTRRTIYRAFAPITNAKLINKIKTHGIKGVFPSQE